MPHLTKMITCHWFLDGFKPESVYYADVREHFSVKELERIDYILAQAYNPEFRLSKKDKAFVLYAMTVVMLTSVQGEEYEEEE